MKQSSNPLVISEGKTLTYLIPVVFCGIAALISFVLFWPLGILLALACIFLGMVETGLEFNRETMEYCKLKSVISFSWGTRKKLPDPESFHLRLSVESQSYRTYFPGTSPTYYGNARASSKSITYDVMVHTQSDQWIILYEFPSYKLALQLIRHLQEMESFEVTDHIALKLQENQEKRAGRSR
jgi:hypothetical protein